MGKVLTMGNAGCIYPNPKPLNPSTVLRRSRYVRESFGPAGPIAICMWVVVKIMVLFLDTLNNRWVPYFVKDPKRDHNFDNYPHIHILNKQTKTGLSGACGFEIKPGWSFKLRCWSLWSLYAQEGC